MTTENYQTDCKFQYDTGSIHQKMFLIDIDTDNQGRSIGFGQRQDHSRAREIIIISFCDAVDIDLDNFALSIGLIMWIGHSKEMRKLTFSALALRRSESICSDEGLTLETSAPRQSSIAISLETYLFHSYDIDLASFSYHALEK